MNYKLYVATAICVHIIRMPPGKNKDCGRSETTRAEGRQRDSEGFWQILSLYQYHPGNISFPYKRNLKKGAKLIIGELKRVLAGNRSVQHPAIGA